MKRVCIFVRIIKLFQSRKIKSNSTIKAQSIRITFAKLLHSDLCFSWRAVYLYLLPICKVMYG